MIFSNLLNFKEKWIFGFILYVLGILLLKEKDKIFVPYLFSNYNSFNSFHYYIYILYEDYFIRNIK